jgi:hypothetical protein
VGGGPADYQFFNELPKEVPHGYACAYIPDSSNLVHSIQQAAGGVSGMDADKQAWLVKYTTGPSHDNTYSPPRSSNYRLDQRNLEGSVWRITKEENDRLH